METFGVDPMKANCTRWESEIEQCTDDLAEVKMKVSGLDEVVANLDKAFSNFSKNFASILAKFHHDELVLVVE